MVLVAVSQKSWISQAPMPKEGPDRPLLSLSGAPFWDGGGIEGGIFEAHEKRRQEQVRREKQEPASPVSVRPGLLSPRDPSIQIVLTFGPKVCTSYLFWGLSYMNLPILY